jgi:ADP-ribose pyrophosphatase
MDAKQLLVTSRFRVEEVSQPLPQGGLAKRAIVRHPGAVTIIPLVAPDRVCLIRNYRVAVGETLIELPAGTLEPDEPAEVTARRELIEETGYSAGRLTRLHEFFTSPGVLDERMYLFIAEELVDVGAEREPGEQIENLVVPWPTALEMVRRGEIRDAKTIVGLLLYDRVYASRSA